MRKLILFAEEMNYFRLLLPVFLLCGCGEKPSAPEKVSIQGAEPEPAMRTLFYNHGPDDDHVAIYLELNPPGSHVSTKSPEDKEFELADETAARIFEQFDHLSLRSRYLHDEGAPRDPLKSHLFWLYDHSTKSNTKYTVPNDELQTVSGLGEFLELLRNTAKIDSEQDDAGKPDPAAS